MVFREREGGGGGGGVVSYEVAGCSNTWALVHGVDFLYLLVTRTATPLFCAASTHTPKSTQDCPTGRPGPSRVCVCVCAWSSMKVVVRLVQINFFNGACTMHRRPRGGNVGWVGRLCCATHTPQSEVTRRPRHANLVKGNGERARIGVVLG